MTASVSKAIPIRQGDAVAYPIRRVFAGGRFRKNATVRYGESTVSCPTIRFVSDDIDHECFGTGIPVGTTILDVAADGKSATLSTPATATALGSGTLAVRTRNLTDFTFASQLRRTKIAGTVIATFDVDTANAAGGELWLRLTPAQTREMTGTAVWDLEATPTGGDPDTWVEGHAVVVRDVTR